MIKIIIFFVKAYEDYFLERIYPVKVFDGINCNLCCVPFGEMIYAGANIGEGNGSYVVIQC